MHLPHLKPGKQFPETRDFFLGLNHNLRLRPGELYDMENLTSDLAPVLSPRAPRGLVRSGTRIRAMADRDGLVYVEDGNLVVKGFAVDMGLTEGPKTLTGMGAYLIVLPDKKYLNLADLTDFGPIEADLTTAGPVTCTQCDQEGRELKAAYVGTRMPEQPADRQLWLDTGEKQLKQWSEDGQLWVVLETPYVKLSAPGIGRGFSRYDGVELSGLPDWELGSLNGTAVLYGRSPDALILPGLLEQTVTLDSPIRIRRRMPELDFLIESGNRLWGCRYGPDADGRVVNELYCSKLGDFRNWSCYAGISTDSYRVSLGADGPFTGAAVLDGHPLFFRETCLHKVFGQYPANFQVRTTRCRGVERGSERSLQVVGQVLYYKSPGAVCAYDGSQPREISQALGTERYRCGVAGAAGGKYYLSLKDSHGGSSLLVYDTVRSLWHREDGLRAEEFCSCGNELYCLAQGGDLVAMLGTAGEQEGEVPWMARSGILGLAQPGNRYLQKLQLRMQLEPGSRVRVLVRYDSAGPWETLGAVEGMSLRSFVFPVLPRRCDHFELELRGQGPARVFSVTRVLTPGGEG